MTLISVVIPVFNECLVIEELVSRVKLNVEKLTSDYEIVIVDDGSTDSTWSEISKEAMRIEKLKGIRFSRNFGHHYAITAGIHSASGEWVVLMDGDLQDRPEVIPALYEKALSGFDVVFVNRVNRPESFGYKTLQKFYYYVLNKLSGMDFDSRQANFSIINKKVVEGFKKFPENARFYGSIIKWLGFSRAYIQADHGTRHIGKPSYTIRKRLDLARDVVIAFSDRPLKFTIKIGIIMVLVSFTTVSVIVFRNWVYGFTVEGWASIVTVIFLCSGVILLQLGIIGVYVGSIFREVKARPLYIISEVTNKKS
jgi:dolichol-phosphate mannosyltransferase